MHRSDGRWAGTSHLDVTGDTDTLGQRKAKALGIIADLQSHLDLFGVAPADAQDTEAQVRRPSLAKTRLYLHLDATDLLDPLVPEGASAGAGQVERLGSATTARITDWLDGTRATIVPVLDPSRDNAVDEHDPPAWMREVVILRDQHCVFPWCRIGARSCDLDHIEPSIPPDQGGPPGQKAPTKLACLCRRHLHLAQPTPHELPRHGPRYDGTPARMNRTLLAETPMPAQGWMTTLRVVVIMAPVTVPLVHDRWGTVKADPVTGDECLMGVSVERFRAAPWDAPAPTRSSSDGGGS